MSEPLAASLDRLAGLAAGDRSSLQKVTAALQRGQAEEAVRSLASLGARAAKHPETLRLLGIAQRMLGRHAAAVASLEAAYQQREDDPLICNSLGGALQAAGRLQEASEAFRRASSLAPAMARPWYNWGKSLIDIHLERDALAPLQRALDIEPGLQPARFSLAYALTTLGETDAAASQYRRVLEQHPNDGEAWMGLANLKSNLFDASDIALLRRALDEPQQDDANRAALGFALAQALHEASEYAQAFAALERANALMRRALPWNARAFSDHVDDLLASRPAQSAIDTDAGAGALFIVGMPRSGSTLVEQVLAAHPQLAAAGESEVLPGLLRAESERRGCALPVWLPQADSEELAVLGRSYLSRVRGQARSQARTVSDKLPGNWLYVAAIRAMLPSARIIVCRRDPLETGFSCFRHRFTPGRQGFSYDLADIGRYWRDFDRACREWKRRFPDHLHELIHEDLIADFEPQVRALLEFCDLGFDASCLHPQQSAGAIHTLSAAQVRQPLRRDTAVARHYKALLDPLRRALEEPGVSPRHAGAAGHRGTRS